MRGRPCGRGGPTGTGWTSGAMTTTSRRRTSSIASATCSCPTSDPPAHYGSCPTSDPPAAHVTLAGRDIVCVGFADWETDLQTNQHHLMSRLAAAGGRGLFVESLGLRRPQLVGRDVRRIARRVRRGLGGPRAVDGLHVLSPLVIPRHDRR